MAGNHFKNGDGERSCSSAAFKWDWKRWRTEWHPAKTVLASAYVSG